MKINVKYTRRFGYILFTLIISVFHINAQSLDKGLIAHYLFNKDLKDVSSYNNHGKLKGGVTFSEDRFGSQCGALHFDGSSGYVTVPNSRSLRSPRNYLSVGVWFKLDQGAGKYKWLTVICKSNLPTEIAESPHYRLQATKSTISINTEFTENYDQDVAIGRWYHYAMVYDGVKVKTYLNGKQFFEFPYTGKFVANNLALEIGRDVPGNLEYYSGSLDDLRIYNRVLSDQEIRAIYNDPQDKLATKPCDTPKPIPPASTPKNPPVITLKRPTNSPVSTQQATAKVEAEITHVSSKRNIQLSINGQKTRDFEFEAKTQRLTFQHKLQKGYNFYEIEAKNKDGEDQASLIINYKPQLPPPVVVKRQLPEILILTPSSSPYRTKEQMQEVEAKIKYVDKKSAITLRVNGTESRNFDFIEPTGDLAFNMKLIEGNNYFEIIGKNEFGQDSKSGVIFYSPLKQPPIITLEYPGKIPEEAKTASQNITAKIEHVSSRDDIEFFFNAERQTDFSFDTNTKKFAAKVVLQPGFNLVEIKASNLDGTDNENGRLRLVPQPPMVDTAETINAEIGEVAIKLDVAVEVPQIQLVCYDHKQHDGDRISLFINDELVVDRILLKPKGPGDFRKYLTMKPNTPYVIVSKAWNLGKIPPNTMTLDILDRGTLLKRVVLESEIGKSEGIRLIYKPSNN